MSSIDMPYIGDNLRKAAWRLNGAVVGNQQMMWRYSGVFLEATCISWVQHFVREAWYAGASIFSGVSSGRNRSISEINIAVLS